MNSIPYSYVEPDGTAWHGRLYSDKVYHCYVRNKIINLRSASCDFGVYIRALFEKTFGN